MLSKHTHNLSLKLIFFILLITLSQSAAYTNICSAFCNTAGCTGQTMYDCGGTTKCYKTANTKWTWITTDLICGFQAISLKQIMDYSDDVGGGISVTAGTGTIGCTFPVSTFYYGLFYATSTPVTATLLGGTMTGHWQFEVYYNLVLIDADASTSNPTKWANNVVFNHELVGSTPAQIKPITFTNPSNSNPSSGILVSSNSQYCGISNKKDSYFRMEVGPYTHNLTGTDISLTITVSGNTGGANAIFMIRQVIFVMFLCDPKCVTCFNGSATGCTSCDPGTPYKLSNTTCALTCMVYGGNYYGNTSDPTLCVYCNTSCITCFQIADNCTVCKTGFYLYFDPNQGFYVCINPCPNLYFANTTAKTCDLCDPNCTTCMINATFCQSCQAGFGWTNFFCLNPCPDGTFSDNSTANCTNCPTQCSLCISLTICTQCVTNYYLSGSTCLNPCPPGEYGDTNGGAGPNTCISCDLSVCATCVTSPTNCLSCNLPLYLHSSTCVTSCPPPLIGYDPTMTCIDCDVTCVRMSVSMKFSDSLSSSLIITVKFSKDINFTAVDYTTFGSVSISNVNIDQSFTQVRTLVDASSFTITLTPLGYIFLYNQTVSFISPVQPTTNYVSLDLTPFHQSVYSNVTTTTWFLMKSPTMTSTQTSIVSTLSQFSGVFSDATTVPFVSFIKKSGLLATLFSGAQITSCSVFANTVPPQNMYEGVRFWAIFVFYDVPSWQKNSDKPNYFVSSQMYQLTKNQRRMFDLNSVYWRFARTGQSSFFLYDAWVPIFLILLCWVGVLIGYLMKNKYKKDIRSYQQPFYSGLHKLHQMVMLYLTMAMMLEWMFFDAASLQRWISLFFCLGFTFYFVSYELYIYYDMIKYPQALIGNHQYQYYFVRYFTFLKNIRYEEYDMKEDWSPRHWFRPYNYHILSYYKKFCMIISLPLFYQVKHAQPIVLCLIQIIQLIRFYKTWPYFQKWRNYFRFTLQIVLLVFFLVLQVLSWIIVEIQMNNQETLSTYIDIYFKLGWFGFVLVWIFNGSFLILFFIDIAQGFRYSNRQLFELPRKQFYFQKINSYQKENQQVPIGLLNKWVKLGNLNKRNHSQLPQINVRIQYFRISRHKQYYNIDVFKVCQLFMNIDFNYNKENNTTNGKTIKKKIRLTKQLNQELYYIINQIYLSNSDKSTQFIILKTFITIQQSQFKAGDRIPLLTQKMFQRVQSSNFKGQKKVNKLPQLIKGFPINPFSLENI